jgi:hypothetical protein
MYPPIGINVSILSRLVLIILTPQPPLHCVPFEEASH